MIKCLKWYFTKLVTRGGIFGIILKEPEMIDEHLIYFAGILTRYADLINKIISL